MESLQTDLYNAPYEEFDEDVWNSDSKPIIRHGQIGHNSEQIYTISLLDVLPSDQKIVSISADKTQLKKIDRAISITSCLGILGSVTLLFAASLDQPILAVPAALLFPASIAGLLNSRI